MKTFMLWHGGASYAGGYVDEDTEVFPSLRAAIAAFKCRAESWNRYYPFVDDIPAEDGGPSAHVWFSDPRGNPDPYPDRILEFGPRGGVQVLRA